MTASMAHKHCIGRRRRPGYILVHLIAFARIMDMFFCFSHTYPLMCSRCVILLWRIQCHASSIREQTARTVAISIQLGQLGLRIVIETGPPISLGYEGYKIKHPQADSSGMSFVQSCPLCIFELALGDFRQCLLNASSVTYPRSLTFGTATVQCLLYEHNVKLCRLMWTYTEKQEFAMNLLTCPVTCATKASVVTKAMSKRDQYRKNIHAVQTQRRVSGLVCLHP